ncbi:hypothetical protein HanIR_Chr04g0178401 [Helianthus annuus]|nr:hypothetical protein HanIR_Chr04g0178401 [Helianthus annuus]
MMWGDKVFNEEDKQGSISDFQISDLNHSTTRGYFFLQPPSSITVYLFFFNSFSCVSYRLVFILLWMYIQLMRITSSSSGWVLEYFFEDSSSILIWEKK